MKLLNLVLLLRFFISPQFDWAGRHPLLSLHIWSRPNVWTPSSCLPLFISKFCICGWSFPWILLAEEGWWIC